MVALISMLMPTRARPVLARRFLDSAFRTCQHPDQVEIIMVVDDDDMTYEGFVSPFEKTKLMTVSPLSMSGYNRFAARTSSGDILMLVNDDIIVESEGWDVVVRKMHESFVDGLYLGFPNDDFKKSRLSVFPILSRRTFDNFDVLPEIYLGAFIDTHLHEIFRFLKTQGHDRICYLADVKFTHRHYRVTKDAPDETYTRRDRFGDDKTFLLHVKARHNISLNMKRFIEVGDISKSQESPQLTQTWIAALCHYLFACPERMGYRIKKVAYVISRFIFKAVFVRD